MGAEVRVWMYFGADWNATSPSWTNITPYVLESQPITIRRGRNNQLDLVEAGTATFLLDNRDQRFRPANTAGPYTPYVKHRTPVLITGRRNGGADRYLFYGFVNSWPRRLPDPKLGVIPIEASDGFSILRRHEIESASYSLERTDQRIQALLTEINWSANVSLDTGKSNVMASALYNTTALAHLNRVVDSELGIFFFDAAGNAVFHNRHRRSTHARSVNVQATFGGPSGLPITDVQVEDDDRFVFNDIRVQRDGGVEQKASDSLSIGKYGRLTLPRSGLLLTSDSECLSQARWLRGRYKDQRERVEVLTFEGQDFETAALADAVMALEISDRVRVIWREPGCVSRGGTAPDLDEQVFVEGFQHEIRQKGADWTCHIRTSPVFYWSFWRAGIAGASEAGQTTRAGY